jgi:hypothetical protein
MYDNDVQNSDEVPVNIRASSRGKTEGTSVMFDYWV